MRGRTDGRVVRGGSFNNNERNVRCAYRNRNNPNNRNNNIGFRVVVSHIIRIG
jgi:formylglycine-generating enzyme required for sulfatase activity